MKGWTKRKETPLVGLVVAGFVAALLAISATPPSVGSAPSVVPWAEPDLRIIYSDTLGMLSSDSVAVTDSVDVFGARYVCLSVTSGGSAGTGAFNGGTGTAYDSTAVPILQTKGLNGNWVGTGSAPYVGTGTLQSKSSTATTLINNETVISYEIMAVQEGSGTPRPWPVSKVRWRIKSANARRYATASSATLSPSGRITYRVLVIR